MLRLRRDIQNNYDKRSTDTVDRIAEEDMQRLQKAKSKLYVWPTVSLLATFGVGWLIGKINLPGMKNQFIEEQSAEAAERKALLQTKFSRTMKTQGLLIVGLASCFISWLYYYGTKYSLYLKYENLVNSYARAVHDDHRRKQLQQLHQTEQL